MRTTTDNRTTCGQLEMLSAFHQKKMRTTFIFPNIDADNFLKIVKKISENKKVKFLEKYEIENQKKLVSRSLFGFFESFYLV